MLQMTGAGSIALAKAMAKCGLVRPTTHKTDRGQNARAWKIEDILRMAVVVDLVPATGLSAAACVAIADLLRPHRLDAVTHAEEIDAELERHRTYLQRAIAEETEMPPMVELPARKDLVRLSLVDRYAVWAQEREDGDQDFTPHAVGRIHDLTSNPVDYSPLTIGLLPFPLESNSFGDIRSILTVKLSNLGMRPIMALSSALSVG